MVFQARSVTFSVGKGASVWGNPGRSRGGDRTSPRKAQTRREPGQDQALVPGTIPETEWINKKTQQGPEQTLVAGPGIAPEYNSNQG